MSATQTKVKKSLPEMKYVRFGNTGLRVSRFALGCMSYGTPNWQSWVKGEEESLDLIKKAYDAGINFFDTADAYSFGESERILGKAIKKFNFRRSKIVVATKVFYANEAFFGTEADFLSASPGLISDSKGYVNQNGLSRKHIFDSIDGSLERLGLDYIDLYQIHRLDHTTPIEETMEALNDLVRSGKVRYIGCSTCHAWEFQKANNIAEKNGWTKFVSMQNLYNLLYREEEREMIPYCADSGIAVIPWSPLARGMLTGKVRSTTRITSDFFTDLLFSKEAENNELIVDRVLTLAEKLGHTPAQIALAWLLTKSAVTSPIVGIGKEEHLYDIIGSLDVTLSEEEVKFLEEAYVVRQTVGF